MIKATGKAVRGRHLYTSLSSFVRNLDIAYDKLTAAPAVEHALNSWRSERLLVLTARTMFDAIFNTVFGRSDGSQFTAQLAYHNFQVPPYSVMTSELELILMNF